MLQYYQNTSQICEGLKKINELNSVLKYTFSDVNNSYSSINDQGEQQLNVLVADVLDIAKKYNRPLVVNCCDKDQSCGRWDTGVQGYEEGLAYRTTLSLSLTDSFYPLEKNNCLYSPDVRVFMDGNYNYVNSYQISVISIPPIIAADFSIVNDKKRFSDILHTIFRISVIHGHTTVIMNTFACNNDNNSDDIAQLIKEISSDYNLRVIIALEKNDKYQLSFKNYCK